MTLIEKVIKNFASIRLKKSSVKIPELEIKQAQAKAQVGQSPTAQLSFAQLAKQAQGIAAVVGRLQKKLKIEEDAKPTAVKQEISDDSIKIIRDEFEAPSSGYGASKASYGMLPSASYSDYDKWFSHLGKFRAGSQMQLSYSEISSETNNNISSITDSEFIRTAASYVKFFKPKSTAMESLALSNVPISGMSGDEWVQFKLWMQLDPVMYRLKMGNG